MDIFMDRIVRFTRKQPSAVQYGVLSSAAALVVLYFFSHDVLYLVSFLAEVLRFLGVLLLLQRIVVNKTCHDISLKSQQLYCAVFFTRMCFKLFYESDMLYAFVEGLCLAATAYIVYLMMGKYNPTYSRENDVVKSWVVLLACILVALVLHPDVTRDWKINVLWAFSTYLECLTLLPQIVIVHRKRSVENMISHYIASLFASRVLEGSFWVIALLIRGYARVWRTIPYYVIVTELVHTALLSDFIFYYIKSWRSNSKMVLPGN